MIAWDRLIGRERHLLMRIRGVRGDGVMGEFLLCFRIDIRARLVLLVLLILGMVRGDMGVLDLRGDIRVRMEGRMRVLRVQESICIRYLAYKRRGD